MGVVVVGAGPAGVATSLLLARAGIDVTLVEREMSFARVFRGEALMPLGVDALEQMGLSGVLAAIPRRAIESWNIVIDRREAFVIPEPTLSSGEGVACVVSQPALLQGMVDQASDCPGMRFVSGARATRLLHDGAGRVGGVEVVVGGRREQLTADLVIGCDGRGSTVRTHAGIQLDLRARGRSRSRGSEPRRQRVEQYDVVWCKLPAPAALQGRCRILLMVAAGAHPVIAYTSWDDRLQLGVVLPKGEATRVLRGDWLAAAAAVAPPPLAEHLLGQRDGRDIDGPLKLNVLVGRCSTWSQPGLLLLGDAAHPMSPVRAQGINLALRDAIVAANHLRAPLRDGDAAAVDAACRRVQAERAPEIIRAQRLQHREARGQGDARSASWKFSLAALVVPTLGRRRWVQRAWLRRQRELRFGSTQVRLHDV